MEKTPAALMKEYVNPQKFTGTTEIIEAMKTMFGDVLQQVMEAELDTKVCIYHLTLPRRKRERRHAISS